MNVWYPFSLNWLYITYPSSADLIFGSTDSAIYNYEYLRFLHWSCVQHFKTRICPFNIVYALSELYITNFACQINLVKKLLELEKTISHCWVHSSSFFTLPLSCLCFNLFLLWHDYFVQQLKAEEWMHRHHLDSASTPNLLGNRISGLDFYLTSFWHHLETLVKWQSNLRMPHPP